jgi:signal transduction histidine kinase
VVFWKKKQQFLEWFNLSYSAKTTLIIILNALLIVAIFILDNLSGHNFSFFIFYLLPVYIVAFYVGLAAGIVFSFLAAFSWFVVELRFYETLRIDQFILWNTFSRLILYLLLGLTVIYIKQSKKQRDTLKRRTEELLTANRDLQSFAYSISHDLRNPVSLIIGFGELIKESGENLSEEQIDALNRIISEGKRVKEIINDLLRLTRIGAQELSFSRINLSDIARDSVEGFGVTYDITRYEIEIEPQMIVNADAGLIRLLMDNLIGNALKFSSKTDTPRIWIGKEKKEGKTVYYIKDNGIGFDVDKSDRIFDPFVRVHSSRDYPGTGIGLSIVRRIIERHRGKIWVSTELNKGTTFFFTLSAK